MVVGVDGEENAEFVLEGSGSDVPVSASARARRPTKPVGSGEFALEADEEGSSKSSDRFKNSIKSVTVFSTVSMAPACSAAANFATTVLKTLGLKMMPARALEAVERCIIRSKRSRPYASR